MATAELYTLVSLWAQQSCVLLSKLRWQPAPLLTEGCHLSHSVCPGYF